MKTYYVMTNDVPYLKDALGRMIEFAMYMAEESGVQSRIDHIKFILDDDDIEVEEVEE